MPTAWSRVLRALFVVYVAATAIHIGWVMLHEPFTFDAWNVAVDTNAQPFSVGRFIDYWTHQYTHSNPRIGQAATYLSYKLEYFAVIATPLAYLALSLAVFVLGTARWPSPRRGRDLMLWSIVIGALWFALPQLGKTIFCRAYGANYVYGAVIQLWFLVPLRLAQDGRGSLPACIAYFVFGIVAGMCNEHTGPTLCAFLVGYALWTQRRTAAKPLLAWAGALGAIIGFAAIFFAPGQGERYEGLAQRATLFGRVIQRGLGGNLEILGDFLLAAAPLLGLVVIVLIVVKEDGAERRAAIRRGLDLVGIALIAGVAIAITIFASPKLGPRFYYVGCALLLAGFIGVADGGLTRRALIPFVVVAVAASAYAAMRTIPLYGRMARASEQRIAALAASEPGTIFFAQGFDQIDDSWWFLGDDFRDARKRDMVAKYFGLAGVVFRAFDPNAPLGVAGVKLVPHYVLEPAGCLDSRGGLTLGAFKGFDLAGLHREMVIGIELLRAKLGTAQLHRLELAVEIDDAAKLPRPRLLIGRWQPDRFEGYVARFERKNRSTTREIRLPKELAGTDAEIFIYQYGGELRRLGTARGEPLRYVPWKSGVYWVLSCDQTECFVIAATRQAG